MPVRASAFCVVKPESVMLPVVESVVCAESVAEGVAVAVAVGVCVEVAVGVSVGLALDASVGLGVGDADSVGLSDGEVLGVTDGLGVPVDVADDDGEVGFDDGAVGEVEPRNEHSCCWLVMAAVSACCSRARFWVSLVTCCCSFLS